MSKISQNYDEIPFVNPDAKMYDVKSWERYIGCEFFSKRARDL